ncbi:MAG: HGxxPAAW family protein [Kineosporiaceae bacterium]
MARETPDPAPTEHEAGIDAPAGEAAPAASPADAAVAHGDHEGNTPAAWTACGGVVVASLVGAFAVVFGSWPLGVVAAALTIVALVAGYAMSRTPGSSGDGAPGGTGGTGLEAHGAPSGTRS